MQNFGKIKNAFYDLLIESIIKKDETKKAIFSEYVKAIKKDKILRTEFLVYTNLEDKSDINENNAINFTKLNVQYLRDFKKTDIQKANENLAEKLGKYKTRLDKPYDDKMTKLHEDITKIIFMSNNPLYVETITESYNNITNYIKSNKPKETIKENLIPTNAIATIAIKKFNEKYSDLNENERILLKTLIETDEVVKEQSQKDIVTECVDLIDAKLINNDSNVKEKLSQVKDKLLTMTYNSSNYNENMNKLIVLKTDLTNN
jgi:hypothetical protein